MFDDKKTIYIIGISLWLFVFFITFPIVKDCSTVSAKDPWALKNCWVSDRQNDHSSLLLHPDNSLPQEPHIRIYFHSANLNGQKEGPKIIEEIMDKIVSSGLMNKTTGIYVSTLGTVKMLQETFKKYDKVNFIAESPDLKLFEFPTLLMMQQHAKKLHPDTKILYLHTKGSSKPTEKYRIYWRRVMLHFVADSHELCLDALSNGCNACGIFWRTAPWHHFPGNFWWTKAKHIANLPDINKLDWKWRFGSERWVGSTGQDTFFYRLFTNINKQAYAEDYKVSQPNFKPKKPFCPYHN